MYDILYDIFSPAANPFFSPQTNDDNVEDAEIIEEVKL